MSDSNLDRPQARRPGKGLYTHRRARRSLIHTAGLRGASQLATMLGFVVFVRSMPALDFGVFNLMYAVIPVVSTLASFGLESTLRRYQPEYLLAGNVSAGHWLVQFVAKARLGANALLLLAIILTWGVTAPLFEIEDYRPHFIAFSVVILIYFQTRILQFALASHMRHADSVGSVMLLSFVRLLCYLGLSAKGLLSLTSAIAVELVAYALAWIWLSAAYRRNCRPPPEATPYQPVAAEKKRLLRYGLFNNFNDAGTLVLTSRSDNFFIAALSGPVAVGVYSFYVRLNEMILHVLPVRLFENVVQPLHFAVRKEGSREKLPRYFSLLLDLNLLVHVPIAAFVFVYHREIVQIVFGGRFLEWSYLLPVVVVFSALNAIDKPVTLTAQYREKAGVILASKVLSVYNVLVLLLLLPRWGVLGAAIASGSAHVFKSIFIWWYVRDDARWLEWPKVVAGTVGLWGLVILTCLALKATLHWPPLIELIAGAIIFGVAALLSLRGPTLSVSDREILAAVLSGREARLLKFLGVLAGKTPLPPR